jgi:hypothetical protein
MTSDQKKLLALALLVAVWGGLAVRQWYFSEAPVRVPLTNVSGPAGSHHPARMPSGGLHVRLDLLATARTQRELSFAAPRNIFALPAAAAAGRSGLDPGSAASPEEESAATALAQYHYLGFVRSGEEGDKTRDLAVLAKDDDLHLVRIGETVDNHIVVKAITQESVTLLDRVSRVEHTVLLSEEAPAQP